MAAERAYPNPIGLAHYWQRLLDTGAADSRSDLAREPGVSRAHVTQVPEKLFWLFETRSKVGWSAHIPSGPPLTSPLRSKSGESTG